MSNKKLDIWIISLFLLLLCVVGGRYGYKRYQAHIKVQAAVNSVAQTYERLGIMKGDEYRKVIQIANSIEQTKSISDADLDWWIQFIKHPADPAKGERSATTRRFIALDRRWKNLTNPTSNQKDKLFELAKVYLVSQPFSGLTKRDTGFGIILVSFLNEQRATSLVAPFLKSTSPTLRDLSSKVIRKWQLQNAT